MPGNLDSSLTAVAERLIRDYGKEAVYTNKIISNPTPEDISEGDFSNNITETNYNVIITPPAPFTESMINDETIRNGDAKVLIKGQDLGFVPYLNDEIVIDGLEYNIVSIDRIYSGRLIAAYEFQLRIMKNA